MRMTLLLTSVLLAAHVARADDSDDTLRFYLGKSDLVILGTIKGEPTGESDEVGVLNYLCDFQVTQVIKGDPELKFQTVRVNIVRFEKAPKDHHPLITKDAECILFLKRQGEGTSPNWATADFWFGVQPPSPWMAGSLKRLTHR